MEDLNSKNLSISEKGMLHVDNFVRKDHNKKFKTLCGIVDPQVYELGHYPNNSIKSASVRLCKKCSKVYFNKYKEPLVSYITVLKLKGQLFI